MHVGCTVGDGLTWSTAGKFGNAIVFGYYGAAVDLGNPGPLQLNGSMTSSAWIYSTAFPESDAAIISKLDGNSGTRQAWEGDTVNLLLDVMRSASSSGCAPRFVGQALLVVLTVLLPSKLALADVGGEKDELNPVLVYGDITRLGEKAVVGALKKKKTQWTVFMSSISSAEQAWIDIGLLLLPHSTGAARIDIRIAFENALVAAPITTIRSIGVQPSNLRVICGPSAQPTYDLAETSIYQRLSTVESLLIQENVGVTDASLKARLNKCADMLEAADVRFRQDWSKPEKVTPRTPRGSVTQ